MSNFPIPSAPPLSELPPSYASVTQQPLHPRSSKPFEPLPSSTSPVSSQSSWQETAKKVVTNAVHILLVTTSLAIPFGAVAFAVEFTGLGCVLMATGAFSYVVGIPLFHAASFVKDNCGAVRAYLNNLFTAKSKTTEETDNSSDASFLYKMAAKIAEWAPSILDFTITHTAPYTFVATYLMGYPMVGLGLLAVSITQFTVRLWVGGDEAWKAWTPFNVE
jgi:hypothetical protein